jgi:hypothetical protein
MTEPNLLAVCGLYCGACYHYRASFSDGKHLLEPAFRGSRPLQGYTCQGCRSDRLYIHAGCADCQIRACAESKGLVHCGECDLTDRDLFDRQQLACERLKAFQNDGRAHHLPILQQLEDVKRKGVGQWLAEQKARWTCACGAPFSWYETVCQRCGKDLNSYANPDNVTPKS